jgi:hypothetical protein
MLVRDQDRIQLFGVFIDEGQAGQNVAPAQPGVDEDARFFGADKGGIAGTAAGENANLNYDGPPFAGNRLLTRAARKFNDPY